MSQSYFIFKSCPNSLSLKFGVLFIRDTICCAALDETGFFQSEISVNPTVQKTLYNAVVIYCPIFDERRFSYSGRLLTKYPYSKSPLVEGNKSAKI